MALYFIFSLVYVLVILCLWFCLWYLIRHSHYPSPLALPVPSPITHHYHVYPTPPSIVPRACSYPYPYPHTSPYSFTLYLHCIPLEDVPVIHLPVPIMPLCRGRPFLFAVARSSTTLPVLLSIYAFWLTTPVSLMCTVACRLSSRPLFPSFCLVPRSRYPRSFSVHAIFRLASLHLAPLCLARDVLYIFLSISAALGYTVVFLTVSERLNWFNAGDRDCPSNLGPGSEEAVESCAVT